MPNPSTPASGSPMAIQSKNEMEIPACWESNPTPMILGGVPTIVVIPPAADP